MEASRLGSLLLLLLALLGQGCPGSGPGEAKAKPPPDPIPVGVEAAARETISAYYATSATLRADRRAIVTARTRGVIRSFGVEEGDEVREGQSLAFLEDDEQRIELERSVALLAIKEKVHSRSQQLHGRNALSDNDLEAARREWEDAKHRAALARLNMERTRIPAPFAGRVLERHLDAGATVSDGTAILDLADVDPLYADVNVPERHVSLLVAGQAVLLTVDASDEVVQARIERIAPAVDPASGTVKVTVAVAEGSGLRPGSFTRVRVVTETRTDALVVPRSALVAEGHRWRLFRVAPETGLAEQLEVVPGFEQGDRVEIRHVTGGRLLAGDRVVVVGASALSDRAPVEVVPPPEREESGEGKPDAS